MKKFMTWLTSKTQGSNSLSFWARIHVEKLPVKQVLGVNLAGLAFAFAVVIPQTNGYISAWEVSQESPTVTLVAGPTERGSQWPLTQFGISQGFRYGHPGMDLTAAYGSPVYPIEPGVVEWTSAISWGYGNHVFVKHDNNLQSLYAHFSKITVQPGQAVGKFTKIGEVGSSGWATGSHVHMEVFQNGVPINPMEILPEIK